MRTSTVVSAPFARLTGSLVNRPATLAGLRLADDELHGGLCRPAAVVAQHGLHADRLAGNVGRGLHGDEVRRAGEDQLHGIENAGDVPLLLEIEAVGIRPAHGIAVRADANQDFIACRS